MEGSSLQMSTRLVILAFDDLAAEQGFFDPNPAGRNRMDQK